MKKLLFTALVLLNITQAFSQSYGGGLQAGFNYSWLNIDSKQAKEIGGRTAFSAGAFFDNNFSDNFSFTTGLNINSTGGTIRYLNPVVLNWDGMDYNVEKDSEVFFKVKQLEIPFSIKGRTQEIGYITYFAKLGMSTSFVIDSKADIITGIATDSKGDPVSDTKDLNIKENINTFNVGWHIGAGFEYSLGGTTAIITEIFFANNFMDLTKDNITANGPKVDARSSMVVFKTGIKF